MPNENNWQPISSIMWLKYTIEMFGEKANIDAWFWKLAPRSSGVVLKRNQTSAVWKRVNEEKNIYFAEVCAMWMNALNGRRVKEVYVLSMHETAPICKVQIEPRRTIGEPTMAVVVVEPIRSWVFSILNLFALFVRWVCNGFWFKRPKNVG